MKSTRFLLIFSLLIVVGVLLASCAPAPTPAPTETALPTETKVIPTSTNTALPTSTITIAPTATVTLIRRRIFQALRFLVRVHQMGFICSIFINQGSIRNTSSKRIMASLSRARSTQPTPIV